MSEWDTGNSGGFDDAASSAGNSKRINTGGLNTTMCIVCLIAVSAVSFLMAWLMKDVVRNFWQMGLTFAAPFAVLMISALFVERNTHLMTPATSLNAQRLFALTTIVVAFAVGCLTVLLHEPVIIIRGGYDYILVIDKSGSMDGHRDVSCRNAANQLIGELSDDTKVGVVAFDDVIRGTADIMPLSATHRADISKVLELQPDGMTNFDLALNKVMEMVDAMNDRNRPIRIIFISDGYDNADSTCKAFIAWAKKMNNQDPAVKQVELCAIQLDMEMPPIVENAVNATGGTIHDQTSADQLAAKLESLKVSGGEENVDILKATYNDEADSNTTYKVLSIVLLLLLGLLTGFSMMIMFSARGQFRVQVIISALVGIVAFLLLNYGKSIGLSPAWVCEAVALSLFGLVFMKTNLNVSGTSEKRVVPETPAAPTEFNDF